MLLRSWLPNVRCAIFTVVCASDFQEYCGISQRRAKKPVCLGETFRKHVVLVQLASGNYLGSQIGTEPLIMDIAMKVSQSIFMSGIIFRPLHVRVGSLFGLINFLSLHH